MIWCFWFQEFSYMSIEVPKQFKQNHVRRDLKDMILLDFSSLAHIDNSAEENDGKALHHLRNSQSMFSNKNMYAGNKARPMEVL